MGLSYNSPWLKVVIVFAIATFAFLLLQTLARYQQKLLLKGECSFLKQCDPFAKFSSSIGFYESRVLNLKNAAYNRS